MHGDIKPENLLLGAPDTPDATRLYMVDLGLAQRYTSSSTARHLPYHQNPNEFRCAQGLKRSDTCRAPHGSCGLLCFLKVSDYLTVEDPVSLSCKAGMTVFGSIIEALTSVFKLDDEIWACVLPEEDNPMLVCPSHCLPACSRAHALLLTQRSSSAALCICISGRENSA